MTSPSIRPGLARGRFYFAVVVPAAVLMALEMVSSRVLAPQFGNSVYVWGSIIGVFLAAMSLGYAWGGRLADRKPSMALLGRLILGAAVAQTVTLLFARPVVTALGDLTRGSPGGTLIATTVLFGPTTVFLATISPYAVKLATEDLQLLGGTAGRLYAISTFASLVGTLGATFVLIPYLDLESILRLLLAATVVSSLVAQFDSWAEERLAITLAACLLAFAGLPHSSGHASGRDVLVDRMTPYQTIQIFDSDGIRFMTGDGTIQSAVDLETREPWLAYARQAPTALLLQPEMKSLLVLGMGAGSVGTHLRGQIPDLEVDFVDIDPAVPELTAEHMFFDPDERMRVHVDDARRFLKSTDETWDYIYADTYIGLAVPFHLTTVEFFELVRQHLRPGGVFGLNLAASLDRPFARAILRSVNGSFQNVAIFGIKGWSNHLVLATEGPAPRSREEFLAAAKQLEGRWTFEPSLRKMASWFVERDLDLTDAFLLTDSFAPVHHLIDLEGDGSPWAGKGHSVALPTTRDADLDEETPDGDD